MPVLFVARSVRTGKWSSDVGRGKNVYKIGISEGEDLKALAAAGWAGESDWKIVGQQEVEGLDEAEAIERLRKKEGKDFTVVLFPHAGHGLLDTPPTDPRAMPTLLAWLQKHVRAT